MREHLVNKRLKDFIGGYYLEDTGVCDEIIEYFNYNSDQQSPGVVGKKNGDGILLDTSIKNSTDITITPQVSIDMWDKVIKTMQLGLDRYLAKWVWANETCRWTVREGFNIQKYGPGGGFHSWHMENSGPSPVVNRHLVWMLYLNDVTDRGQTEFFYQKLKVKPEKGLMLFWPAPWTHTHRGISSPTQEKYIATGWYSFVEE